MPTGSGSRSAASRSCAATPPAGLLVVDEVVSAPPGRECELVPYPRRATALYRLAVLEGPELGGADPGPRGLGWTALAPGAAAELRAVQWGSQAVELRSRADQLGDAAWARGLAARADELDGAGTVLTRGTTVATFPAGVLVDEANGESWEQAAAPQGAGLVAGGLASAGAAAAMTSWTGPGAVAAGVIAVGVGVGVGVGMATDGAVDARYAGAARCGRPAGLAARCGRAGQRRRPPHQSKYGVR